jgi:uncharacterized protein YkwD
MPHSVQLSNSSQSNNSAQSNCPAQPVASSKAPVAATGRSSVYRRMVAGTAALAVGFGALIGLTAAPAAQATTTEPAVERVFVSHVNKERQHRRIRSLATSTDLTTVARTWARSMARSGVLRHNPQLTRDVHGWRYLGENVGVGGSEWPLHQALMASPPHRANILSSHYTQVGVGVAYGRGRVWVVQVFRQPTSRAAAAVSRSSSPTIGYGSRGATVRALQRRLHIHSDGVFGRSTLRHLVAYQRRHHLSATGRLDARTRRYLHI